MNRWKHNSNKFVKKERIRKLRGLERCAVAVATAASFALMLSSCEEFELPTQTTHGGAQTQTRISEASTAWTESTSDLPFAPPVSEPTDTSDSEITAPSPDENNNDNIEMPDVPDDGDDIGSSEMPEKTEPPASDSGSEPEPDIDDDTEVEPVVEVRTSIHFEAIPFRTVYVNDPNMYDDETVVQSEGKNGSVKITIYSTYIDGVLDSSRSQRETLYFSQDCVIKRGTRPSITTEEKTVKETVEKYSTIYEECDTMEIGTTQIKTEGKDSVATRTYRYTYTRGVLTSRELISESISERVDEVVLVGTKEPEKVTDTSFGMPFIDAAHGGVDYSVTQYFSSSHNALDFGVYYGDPIVAAMSGTVIAAYDEGYFSTDNILWTYGTYVVIQHDGYRTYYAHMSSRAVSVGDTVEKGQVIGYSGNTGRVNSSAGGPYAGTHLHFEIRKYYSSLGVYHTVDPTLYLPWWN